MTNEAEKMAERLASDAAEFNHDGACWPGDIMAEAAALIRRLAAENAALKAELMDANIERMASEAALEMALERIKRLEEAQAIEQM
ncbi:MAG: hypothetical protein ACK5QX_06380, partial [bacterium]